MVGVMEDKQAEAYEDYTATRDVVLEMVPTTLVGIKAKISILTEDDLHECLTSTETIEPLMAFLNTLYESARLIAAA